MAEEVMEAVVEVGDHVFPQDRFGTVEDFVIMIIMVMNIIYIVQPRQEK